MMAHSWSPETGLLALTLTLGLLFQMAVTKAECPETCSCKWKGGKQSVECVNASLTAIPSIERDTQVLDLSHNYLPVLPTDIFLTLNLPNLQKIYLARSSVKSVADHCFRGLTNLIELDLSYNGLTRLPLFTEEDCKYLMRLSLKGNQIREIPNEAFQALSDLNSLDLGECGLETLGPSTLAGLVHLEYLRLESNRLRTLDPIQSFPPKLRDLTLHGNRWHCDCQLLGMHQWLGNYSVPYSVEPKCHSPPRIINEEITRLESTEFACIPEVSPTSMYLEVIEGKNMSLVCSVKAVPDAQIMWKYRDTFINNGSTLIDDIDMRHYFYIQTLVTPGHRKSELFLSSTTTEDNGTFLCVAENKAGQAVAQFTLHVVVPMPPKPPQDVVEERFNMEYIIAIVIAATLIVLIAFVLFTLTAMRCQRQREKQRGRKRSLEQQQLSLSSPSHVQHSSQAPNGHMVRSRSGGELSCTDSLSTQMTASITSGHGHNNGNSGHADHGSMVSNSQPPMHQHHHRLFHNDYQQPPQAQLPPTPKAHNNNNNDREGNNHDHIPSLSGSNSQKTFRTSSCSPSAEGTNLNYIHGPVPAVVTHPDSTPSSTVASSSLAGSSDTAKTTWSGQEEMKLALSNSSLMTGSKHSGPRDDPGEGSLSSANEDADGYHESTIHELEHCLPPGHRLKALGVSEHPTGTLDPARSKPQPPPKRSSLSRPTRSSSFDLVQSSPCGEAVLLAKSHPGMVVSPPTPFADDSFLSKCASQPLKETLTRGGYSAADHGKVLSTGPRHLASTHIPLKNVPMKRSHHLLASTSSSLSHSSASGGREGSVQRQSRTLPRKLAQDGSRVLPPPPQYKGVHFAPNVRNNEDKSRPNFVIPTEGLPTRPAQGQPPSHEGHCHQRGIISAQVETISIVVRGKNGPPPMLKPLKASSSMTFTSLKGEIGRATSSSPTKGRVLPQSCQPEGRSEPHMVAHWSEAPTANKESTLGMTGNASQPTTQTSVNNKDTMMVQSPNPSSLTPLGSAESSVTTAPLN